MAESRVAPGPAESEYGDWYTRLEVWFISYLPLYVTPDFFSVHQIWDISFCSQHKNKFNHGPVEIIPFQKSHGCPREVYINTYDSPNWCDPDIKKSPEEFKTCQHRVKKFTELPIWKSDARSWKFTFTNQTGKCFSTLMNKIIMAPSMIYSHQRYHKKQWPSKAQPLCNSAVAISDGLPV